MLVVLGHAPRRHKAHFAEAVDLRVSAGDPLTSPQCRLRSR